MPPGPELSAASVSFFSLRTRFSASGDPSPSGTDIAIWCLLTMTYRFFSPSSLSLFAMRRSQTSLHASMSPRNIESRGISSARRTEEAPHTTCRPGSILFKSERGERSLILGGILASLAGLLVRRLGTVRVADPYIGSARSNTAAGCRCHFPGSHYFGLVRFRRSLTEAARIRMDRIASSLLP